MRALFYVSEKHWLRDEDEGLRRIVLAPDPVYSAHIKGEISITCSAEMSEEFPVGSKVTMEFKGEK